MPLSFEQDSPFGWITRKAIRHGSTAIMKRSFEWNGDKAKATREKYRVGFDEIPPFSPIPLQSPSMTMTPQRMNRKC
jgi:hypothetical protein